MLAETTCSSTGNPAVNPQMNETALGADPLAVIVPLSVALVARTDVALTVAALGRPTGVAFVVLELSDEPATLTDLIVTGYD